MKKAIANLGFSDLKVRYFTGRSILISDTGQGKRYQYRNGCMTALGDLEISEWREMITELIAYRSEQELKSNSMSGVQNTHPGFTGKVKSQIMHWNAMLQDFLMIRFGQIISRLTENTDQMFWIRRS